MTLQQQIRRKMEDFLQRVREEMHTAINGRLDPISSISSAMQRLSAGLAETAKPYRISDLIPKSWDGNHDKRSVQELHGRAALVDASKHGQTRVREIWLELRVSTRWKAQHWLCIARKQTSEHSKPLCTRSCTGRQQMNHGGWFNKYGVREDLKLGT